jgi:hypothetical protein
MEFRMKARPCVICNERMGLYKGGRCAACYQDWRATGEDTVPAKQLRRCVQCGADAEPGSLCCDSCLAHRERQRLERQRESECECHGRHVCNDCLDRFSAWLAKEKERYGEVVLVITKP